MTVGNVKTAYFYHLGLPQKDLCLCHLAEKYYEDGNKVFILADSLSHAELLDKLLWTFKQSSFIPHEIIGSNTQHTDVQVVISVDFINKFNSGVLLISQNISDANRDFLLSFPVIVDFADKWDDHLAETSRKRYALIGSLGYNMVYEKNLPFNLK